MWFSPVRKVTNNRLKQPAKKWDRKAVRNSPEQQQISPTVSVTNSTILHSNIRIRVPVGSRRGRRRGRRGFADASEVSCVNKSPQFSNFLTNGVSHDFKGPNESIRHTYRKFDN